jgi:hypothetical protein
MLRLWRLRCPPEQVADAGWRRLEGANPNRQSGCSPSLAHLLFLSQRSVSPACERGKCNFPALGQGFGNLASASRPSRRASARPVRFGRSHSHLPKCPEGAGGIWSHHLLGELSMPASKATNGVFAAFPVAEPSELLTQVLRVSSQLCCQRFGRSPCHLPKCPEGAQGICGPLPGSHLRAAEESSPERVARRREQACGNGVSLRCDRSRSSAGLRDCGQRAANDPLRGEAEQASQPDSLRSGAEPEPFVLGSGLQNFEGASDGQKWLYLAELLVWPAPVDRGVLDTPRRRV